jgi:deoxyribose-phosphate aldolase
MEAATTPPEEDVRGLARRIDHTLLRPEATASEIDVLCDEAARHGFASVCVHGIWVGRCAERLLGSRVAVCAVAGFPLGGMASEAKSFEARCAIEDGAREIDMVLAIGALKSGDDRLVREDISAVAEVCRSRGALLKVILETALLTEEEKARACTIAKAAGADFVKTSTGFSKGGATVADVSLLRRIVGPELGVKASGGIRDAKTALEMIRAGATRLGTSSSVRIVSGGTGAANY